MKYALNEILLRYNKNEILCFATTWMKVKYIILNIISEENKNNTELSHSYILNENRKQKSRKF